MATMTKAQKDKKAKELALGMFTLPESTEQVGDFTYAVLIPSGEIDEDEHWVEFSLVAKSNKATKVNDAYDPFEKREEWLFEKEQKEKAAEEKRAAKSKKIERDKAARAKREAERSKRLAEREAAQAEQGEGV